MPLSGEQQRGSSRRVRGPMLLSGDRQRSSSHRCRDFVLFEGAQKSSELRFPWGHRETSSMFTTPFAAAPLSTPRLLPLPLRGGGALQGRRASISIYIYIYIFIFIMCIYIYIYNVYIYISGWTHPQSH